MIRVGLLLDGTSVERWVFEAIQAIRRLGCAEITLVVVNGAAGQASRAGAGSKSGRVAFDTYRLMDRLLFPPVDDPFGLVDLSSELGAAKVLNVVPKMGRFSDSFAPEDIVDIEAENVDVLLRFGFRILRGPILHAAKYGVWSFHNGDNQAYRGGPPCYWEVSEDVPATGAVVQILSEELGGGKVLDRVWCATNRHSVGRSYAELCWNCVQILPQLLLRLSKEGFKELLKSASRRNLQPYDRPLYRTPTNTQALGAALRIFWRAALATALKPITVKHWRLLYTFEEELGSTPVYKYAQLAPSKDRIWADPFVVKRDGLYYVFIEEHIYSNSFGHISVFALDHRGKVVGDPKIVLREDYHLSYPFVFEAQDRLWMVPESSQDKRVWLYECARFPDVWEKKRCIMKDIIAVDPTIFFHNGRWWMFLSVARAFATPAYTYLHLFHSADPTGDQWEPHPKNPIVSDVRRARPAGKPFIQGNQLYRPSQDCSGIYGRRVIINRVITLNEREYEEEEVASIEPSLSPNQLGVHTLNRCDSLTILDSRFRVSALG